MAKIDETDAVEDQSPEQNKREYPFARVPGRQRPQLKSLIIVAVVVALVAGGIWWVHASAWEATDDAQVDAHIFAVSSRISGHVSNVYVDDNQKVKAGDVLVEIDPADYQVGVQRAEAELADAQANAEAAKVGLPIATTTAESQVSSAQAGVQDMQAGLQSAQQQHDASTARLREAQANNVKAQADLERYRQLVQKDEISRQQYDQAVAAAQAAAAKVDAAQAGVGSAQQQISQARGKLAESQASLRTANTAPQQIENSRAKFAAAQAQVQKAQANLDQARLNLQYAKVVAPVDGVIGRKAVEAGQNVQPGQQLMSLVALNDVWVTANFKETQLKKMRPGQEAKIRVDALGRDLEGKIESIGGASGSRFSLLPPENATGNYVKVVQRIPVKIVLNGGQNNDRTLSAGMSVEARVHIK